MTTKANESSGAAVIEDDGEKLQTSVIPLTEILGPKEQPRTFFDMLELEALAEDMKTNGQIQPIRVRAFHPTKGSDRIMYQILWGERRFRAAKMNLWETIRAEVESEDTPELAADELLFRQLSENAARASLSPIEEGRAFKRLVDAGHEVGEIAERIRQSQSHVYTRMKFAEALAPAAILALNEKKITPGHAERLCPLSHKDQRAALEECVSMDMSVREFREYCDQRFRTEKAAEKAEKAAVTAPAPQSAPAAGALYFGPSGQPSTPLHEVNGVRVPVFTPTTEGQATEQLAADAKPIERKAELPSGPVADRQQVNSAKRAEDDKFEVAVRRRIIGKILRAANGSKAGLEFIRQYVIRVTSDFAREYPEEMKVLKELVSNVSFTKVEDLYKPFQILIGMEIVGYCEAATTSASLERPKDLIALAVLAGVDLVKCEAEEKDAIAGMAAKAAKQKPVKAPKKPSWRTVCKKPKPAVKAVSVAKSTGKAANGRGRTSGTKGGAKK